MLAFVGVRDGDRWSLVLRHASLQLGLATFGVAIALTLQAHLGLTPWDVLHQGLARHTPLTIGEASEVVGLTIIVASLLLGIRPGFATVCNMALVGFWLDRVLQWRLVPDAGSAPLAVRLAMLAVALVIFGLASGAYISPGMGAGPRDSFMLALTVRTGQSVALTRALVEVGACGVGALLGGSVGLGTVLTALLIGPATQIGFRLFHVDVHAPRRAVAGLSEGPGIGALEEPLTAGM